MLQVKFWITTSYLPVFLVTAKVVRGRRLMVTVDILVSIHDGYLDVVLVLFSSAQLDELDIDQDCAQIEERAKKVGAPHNAGDGLRMDGMDGEYERRKEAGLCIRKHIGRELVHKERDDTMQEVVDQVIAARFQPGHHVVETESQDCQRTVGAVWVGRGDGSSPVVIVENLADGSFQLDVGIGEDCSAETDENDLFELVSSWNRI